MGVDLSAIQNDLKAAVAVGTTAADPFVHSDKGKAAEAKAVQEAQIGIAVLPLLADLFHGIGNLFSHLHKSK